MELADRAVGFLLSFISLYKHIIHFGSSSCHLWTVIILSTTIYYPQEYAIQIPLCSGLLLCLLCMFIGFVMLKSKKKKA